MKALLNGIRTYADKVALVCIYILYNDCYTIEHSQIDIFGCDKLWGIVNRNKTHWVMMVITLVQ